MINKTISTLFILFIAVNSWAQTDTLPSQADTIPAKKDSLDGFDKFNKKAEKLFKILPVPIYSYSQEAGNTFGLAKFNLFHLSKKDTISKPSKISEVVTFSTEGRVNASASTELVFRENRNIIIAFINYKKQPEYIFGIGNDVTKETQEQVQFERFRFSSTNLFRVAKDFYAGVPIDISTYYNIEPDSGSFLIQDNVTGVDGGFSFGFGANAALDSRDNRYNAYKGAYIIMVALWHPESLGAYDYFRMDLDARKYFNPWLNHVIAIQGTTTYCSGNVPFYDLALMGGDSKMRGYYQGAFRDKVLVDAQVEYRMPIWKIFGITGWIGTGRVASSYSDLSFDGFKLSYGGGLRIKVDSKNNTNLRLDFGFGPGGISGTYISFAEAF